ncbi:hypothetical protein MFRU_007g00790 [Monilinia fructicola]|nr:hypothetical protein MFRU_007g00790 [Monilinia fructicola]
MRSGVFHSEDTRTPDIAFISCLSVNKTGDFVSSIDTHFHLFAQDLTLALGHFPPRRPRARAAHDVHLGNIDASSSFFLGWTSQDLAIAIDRALPTSANVDEGPGQHRHSSLTQALTNGRDAWGIGTSKQAILSRSRMHMRRRLIASMPAIARATAPRARFRPFNRKP